MEGDLNLGPASGRGEQTALVAQNPCAVPSELPPILDLICAKALRDNLAALLGQHALILDAGAVERMSTPCAQVILAAGWAAVSAGAPCKILNASAVFRTAIADLGLHSEFSKWMD
jgi:chemotaxis protein CheX